MTALDWIVSQPQTSAEVNDSAEHTCHRVTQQEHNAQPVHCAALRTLYEVQYDTCPLLIKYIWSTALIIFHYVGVLHYLISLQLLQLPTSKYFFIWCLVIISFIVSIVVITNILA